MWMRFAGIVFACSLVLVGGLHTCLMVNSPGLPMLTGPMVSVWFINFISLKRGDPESRAVFGLEQA